MSHTVVAIGDWHGNTSYALKSLQHVIDNYPQSYLVHVGDFGFWDTNIFSSKKNPKPQGFVYEINKMLEENDAYLHVVMGNHENYWAMDHVFGYHAFFNTDNHSYRKPGSSPETYIDNEACSSLYIPGDTFSKDDLYKKEYIDDKGFLISDIYPRIKVIPRGFIWSWDKFVYASLGGAGSVDMDYRTTGKSWWPEEAISQEQVDRFLHLVESSPYDHVDIMFCHDIPLTIVDEIDKKFPELNIRKEVLDYTRKVESHLDNVVSKIKPTLLVSGHMHMRYSTYLHGHTYVEIVNRDNSPIEENCLVIKNNHC